MKPTINDSRVSRRSRPRPAPASAAVLAAALALAGCGHGGRGAEGAGDAGRAPIEVSAIAPDSAAGGRLVLAARVKAREEATVAARLAGRVTAILVKEGQPVRAGQPLARFDAPESRAALDAARREADAAQRALAIAARQALRMDSLFVRGVATARERELADTDRELAVARAEGARAALAETEAAVAPPAPFAGVVVRRHVDAGADVMPGAPLFDVRSARGIEVVVPVPEAALPAVPGARWTVLGADGAAHAATLASIDGMTDPATRTRTAHLAPADAALEPGAFVRVALASPRLAVTPGAPTGGVRLLPQSALVRRGALRGAFVLTPEGRAELRWLKLAADDTDPVEVLSGLFPGERVARDARGLADGARVKVRP